MLLQIEETLDDPTDLSILLEEESEAKPWSVLRGTAPRVALRHLCSKFRCLSRGPATSKALAAFSVSGGRDSLLRGMRRHNAEHAVRNRRPHLPIPDRIPRAKTNDQPGNSKQRAWRARALMMGSALSFQMWAVMDEWGTLKARKPMQFFVSNFKSLSCAETVCQLSFIWLGALQCRAPGQLLPHHCERARLGGRICGVELPNAPPMGHAIVERGPGS